MKLKIYQVDAFTSSLFKGNPAAVCPLEEWPDDAFLQNIAMENNLSETAFYVRSGDAYSIRWFTPTCEVDLCGHATLATAFVLFFHEGHNDNTITFDSLRSGQLKVRREGDFMILNFPYDMPQKIAIDDEFTAGMNIMPLEAYRGRSDFMIVYGSEEDVRNLKPDYKKVAEACVRGIIATAKGNNCDFVSRFFGPQSGVDEDPVTGSAHTTLVPYWSRILNKKELTAWQVSARGGVLKCKDLGDRVEIGGQALLYMKGEIFL